MIKLERKPKPKILEENQATWQHALDQEIQKYGSYDKIPQTEKDGLTCNYRHDQIKEQLFKSSGDKCAFCECKPGE